MSWNLFQRSPRQIGPYEVLAKIGRGSYGSVFKARHRESGELVAIKLLSDSATRDPILLKRFQQEIVASRALEHPYIVRGLDFGDTPAPYLVMEFVDGVSLMSHLKAAGRMAERQALQITTQIAQALEYAHQRGMIHRDVHPGNILLTAAGRARLTDFGLVKCPESGLNLTATAVSLGTPCFMAPEQFEDAKRIDRRCDIYGLAATLYRTVTGERPYKAPGYGATIRKKLDGEIVPPRQLTPGLSLRVDWAILRALSVSPVMRPASCAEFIHDLTGRQLPAGAPRRPALHASQDKERRLAVRHPCRFERVRVWPASGGSSWQAQLSNLSTTGLAVVVNGRLEPGAVLAVQPPSFLQDSLDSMTARVIHAQAQGPDTWVLGCQLEQDLGEECSRILLGREYGAAG
jgi:serine/threonine-protein kinase